MPKEYLASLKPWYKITDIHSPKEYQTKYVYIYPGVKSLPGIQVKVSNDKIYRVRFIGFRSVHKIEDVYWVVENKDIFIEWLGVIEPIRKLDTMEELEKHLTSIGIARRN